MATDDVRLPAWTWDEGKGGWFPRCPECDGVARTSAGYLVCQGWGSKHYRQRLDLVIERTRGLLAGP